MRLHRAEYNNEQSLLIFNSLKYGCTDTYNMLPSDVSERLLYSKIFHGVSIFEWNTQLLQMQLSRVKNDVIPDLIDHTIEYQQIDCTILHPWKEQIFQLLIHHFLDFATKSTIDRQ